LEVTEVPLTPNDDPKMVIDRDPDFARLVTVNAEIVGIETDIEMADAGPA
jgi:hypothetical protein